MRILVIEDDDTLRGQWTDALAEAGHVVTGVGATSAAREALHLARYDVVVLDLPLDKATGLSLATLAAHTNPDCRVVVVTEAPVFAWGELFDLSPAVSTVLRKPVRAEDLLAVCEHDQPG